MAREFLISVHWAKN